MKYHCLLIVICALCVPWADTLSPMLSQDSFYIGDRITYSVGIRVPHGTTLIPPATDEGFGKFSIKGVSIDTGKGTTADTFRIHYKLAAYTVEQCTIPSVHFILEHDSVADTLPVKEALLRFVPMSGKDTGEIHDLKPQQVVGKPPLIWLWILLALAGIAAAWYAGKKLIRRRKELIETGVPLKPPYEEAMDALTALEAKNYYQQGMIREYVFELSELLKHYIGRRYCINASEFTTEEMLEWIRTSECILNRALLPTGFFETTDPIKFARWLPDNVTFLRFGADIRAFLELTKPVTVVPTQKPGDSNAV